MANSIFTKFGTVEVSNPHYSAATRNKVITLNITPENNDGWGVSKEYPADLEVTKKIAESFAEKAMEYL